MKQLSFEIRNEDDFIAALDSVRNMPEYSKASDILSIATLGDQESSFAERLIELYSEKLPKGSFCGYTTANITVNGQRIEGGSSVTFFIFESSTVKVIPYESVADDGAKSTSLSPEEAAAYVVSTIEENADSRVLMLFPDIYHVQRLDLFLNNLTFKDADFPVVGGAAGGVWGTNGFGPMFVFADHVYRGGILSVILSGADLAVETRAERGWTPIGRGHKITKLTSPVTVAEIDDEPAPYVFKKYFNIDPDQNFTTNILGFPFMMRRFGEDIPRSVLGLTEDGCLSFGSDLSEGETFHFSFGEIGHMLKNSAEFAKSLRPFAPQGVYLIICDYRQSFFGAEAQKEIDSYGVLTDHVSGGGAFGEFYHIGNSVQCLNCSLMTLAMREGAPDESILPPLPEEETENAHSTIPMQDRLFSFLSATSNEYAQLRARERERDLREKLEVAHAASEAKSIFLSNVSHEIRTPINAILGMNEMILREAEEEKILDYSEDIKSAGNSLLSLINDILDFSKIEAGKLEIIPVEYSLSSLINDLISMIDPLAQKKNLSLSCDYDVEAPDRLYGDVVRIRQIIVNLMNNAVKFTEQGSVKLTVNFVKTKRDEINLEFHVIDTGIGIREEDLEKLFLPFERLEEKKIKGIEGTGLGMSISRQLLGIMGSNLEVKSVFGEGSDFSFVIRQKVFSFEPIGDHFKKARDKHGHNRVSKETFHAPDAKILVVDDMEMNLSVVKNLLRRTEIKIETALSGQESIALAKSRPYDIIFMDHRMPVMDGIEAMQRIHALPAGNPNENTPIIALTASAVVGTKDRFLKDGFTDYIPKPIDPNALEKMIRSYLPAEKVTVTVDDSEDEDEMTASDGTLSEFLRNLIYSDEIDVPAGITSCGGNETYEKVLQEFVRTAADKQNVIRNDLIEEDYSDYTIRVHALKSSARLAGALTLSRHSAYLEQCSDAMRTEEIIKKTPRLLEEYSRIVTTIENAMPKDDTEREDIDVEMLHEAMQAIFESVQAFDYDGADNVMIELKKYNIPEIEKDRFEKLDLLLTSVDHDGIIELLGKEFGKN